LPYEEAKAEDIHFLQKFCFFEKTVPYVMKKTQHRFLLGGILLLVALSVAFIFWQGRKKETAGTRPTYQPAASGTVGKILVSMDPTAWKAGIGEQVRHCLQLPVPGLPQPEPFFTYIFISPPDFDGFKIFRQVLFVADLSDSSAATRRILRLLNPEELQQFSASKQAATLFLQYDRYAKGQLLVFLVGKNAQALQRYLQNEASQEQLLFVFEDHLATYMAESIQRAKVHAVSLMNTLKRKFGLSLSLPPSYKEVLSDKDFIWIGTVSDNAYQNIWISRLPLRAKEMYDTTFIIQHRDRIGKHFLRYNPEREGSFVQTETRVPLHVRNTHLNDIPVREYAGLWALENRRRGGGFVGYAFEHKGYFYYIEAYIYAPSREKLPILRRLKGILNTMQLFDNREESPVALR
jgi:hypothetical protein